jgi:hypothetical protein
MARNSARNISQCAAAVKNASTSHNAACTGLRAVTTRSAANTRIAEKR